MITLEASPAIVPGLNRELAETAPAIQVPRQPPSDWLRWARHARDFFSGRLPGQLVIQVSDKCNALCPQCGMRATERYPRAKLAEDVIQRMIDSAVAKGIEVISFTGGEPLMFLDEIVRLSNYAAAAGIKFIRTGTNGYLFAGSRADDDRIRRVAEKIAGSAIRNFWISIDSADVEYHETMRGFPGVIRGIERALPIFNELGVHPSANLGINRNVGGASTAQLNQAPGQSEADYLAAFEQSFTEGFERFYRFVGDMGFSIVNTCYPMSVEGNSVGLQAVYTASSPDRIVRFTTGEKAVLFRVLFDTIPRFRSRLRIFSPRCSLHALVQQYTGRPQRTAGCRGGLDYFFVNAQDGNTYPCGFRGQDNLGKFWDLDRAKLREEEPCRRCDWECFRDPSEFFSVPLEALTAPDRLIGRVREDREFLRLWWEDYNYYRDCDFFDGRRPSNAERLAKWKID